jgi:hypothetical protein
LEPFVELVAALHAPKARFVLIGVAGVNYHALGARRSSSRRIATCFSPRIPPTSWRPGRPADPRARLRHIVESKAAAGRDKDRLFLATHEEALRQLGMLDATEE